MVEIFCRLYFDRKNLNVVEIRFCFDELYIVCVYIDYKLDYISVYFRLWGSGDLGLTLFL